MYGCREEGGREGGKEGGQTCILTWLKVHIKRLHLEISQGMCNALQDTVQRVCSVFTFSPSTDTFFQISFHKYCKLNRYWLEHSFTFAQIIRP